MEKIKSYIINAKLIKFTNDKSGELVEITKIKYCRESADTENSVGYDIFEANVRGNVLGKIQNNTMKFVTLGVENIPTNKGYDVRIRELNGQAL